MNNKFSDLSNRPSAVFLPAIINDESNKSIDKFNFKKKYAIFLNKLTLHFRIDSVSSEACYCASQKSSTYDLSELHQRPLATFISGSTYLGTWDRFRMSGYGIYTFTDGTVYEGEFKDGHFDGVGKLSMPNGGVIKGIWEKGHNVKMSLKYSDGLKYKEKDWMYCYGNNRK